MKRWLVKMDGNEELEGEESLEELLRQVSDVHEVRTHFLRLFMLLTNDPRLFLNYRWNGASFFFSASRHWANTFGPGQCTVQHVPVCCISTCVYSTISIESPLYFPFLHSFVNQALWPSPALLHSYSPPTPDHDFLTLHQCIYQSIVNKRSC